MDADEPNPSALSTALDTLRPPALRELLNGSNGRSSAARPAWRWPRARRLLEGSGWGISRLAFDGLVLLAVLALVTRVVPASSVEEPLSIWSYPAFGLALLAARGLYRDDARLARLDAVARIAGALSLAAMFVIVVGAVLEPDSRPTLLAGPTWLGSIIAVTAGHLAFEWMRQRARELGVAGKSTLIVGAGQVGGRIEHRLLEHPELGLRPIGFVDSARMDEGSEGTVLGDPSELREVIQHTGAEHVIFAFLPIPDSDLLPLVRDCEELGVGISVVPRLFETTRSRVVLNHIGGLPLFAFRRVDPKGWQFTLKHLCDRIAAALLLLLVAPLFAAVALAVKLSSPGPVLFRQARVGRDGTEFHILKFRTMRPVGVGGAVSSELDSDVAPGGVEGSDRRTRVGAFLRRTSLDELPQLLNVLWGDMSMVGPRPERPEYVQLFTDNVSRYGDRHRVKSGITGWAQVHGLRGQTSLSDRVEWDNYYIENWSLWLDSKILLMTLVAALRGE